MPSKKVSMQDVLQWSVDELASWLSKSKFGDAKDKVKRLKMDGRGFLKTPLTEVKSKFGLSNDKARKLEEILDELQQEYHETLSDESFDDVVEYEGAIYESDLPNEVNIPPAVERPLPPTPHDTGRVKEEEEDKEEDEQDFYLNQTETDQFLQSQYHQPHITKSNNDNSNRERNDILRGGQRVEERPITVKYAQPQINPNKAPMSSSAAHLSPSFSPPPIPNFPPLSTPNLTRTSPSTQNHHFINEIYEDDECDNGDRGALPEPPINNLQEYELMDEISPLQPPNYKMEAIQLAPRDRPLPIPSSEQLTDDYECVEDLLKPSLPPSLPPLRKNMADVSGSEANTPLIRPKPAGAKVDNRLLVSPSMILGGKENLKKISPSNTASPKSPQISAFQFPPSDHKMANTPRQPAKIPMSLPKPKPHSSSQTPPSINSPSNFKPPSNPPRLQKYPPQIPISNKQSEKTWYKDWNRRETKDFLEKSRKNGTFVIRPSEKEADKPFTLVLYVDGVRNVPIRKNQHAQYALGKSYKTNEKMFATLEEMVDYYRKYEVEVMTEGVKKTTKLL